MIYSVVCISLPINSWQFNMEEKIFNSTYSVILIITFLKNVWSSGSLSNCDIQTTTTSQHHDFVIYSM